ncbi:MAG: hypothetical protein ACHQ9S_23475 [Candidatus Binatia bacterium]
MRGRMRDREKARAHVVDAATAVYRDAVGDHDAFARAAKKIDGPSFLIGTARDSMGTPVPVRLPMDALSVHWLVQGGTGTGKTTFVTSFVAWALAHGVPIGVVDCKSGFFQSVIQWVGVLTYLMSPEQRSAFLRRLAIINPFGTALVPLNVCRVVPGVSAEVQAYDVTLAVSRLFDTALSLHMENILRHALLLLTAANLSLVEIPAVLEDELLRGVLVERYGDVRLKEFFFRTYPTLPDTSKHALGARLQALLMPENLRLMLGADECIDFRGILTRGEPLLVFLGKGLNVPEELVTVLGSLLMQLIFQGAYASEGRHRSYTLVLDEFFHLLDAPGLAERFATALTTLRSFRTHLCLVMHNFSQVPPSLRETLLANCDLMALFRTSSRNAEFFGDFLPDVDPELIAQTLRRSGEVPTRNDMRRAASEQLQRLPDRHCFWSDRRQPYRSVRVRVRDLPRPYDAVGLSEKELEAFIAEQQIGVGAYAVPRETLREQIAARQERLRALLQPPVTVSDRKPARTEAGEKGRGQPRRKLQLG